MKHSQNISSTLSTRNSTWINIECHDVNGLSVAYVTVLTFGYFENNQQHTIEKHILMFLFGYFVRQIEICQLHISIFQYTDTYHMRPARYIQPTFPCCINIGQNHINLVYYGIWDKINGRCWTLSKATHLLGSVARCNEFIQTANSL